MLAHDPGTRLGTDPESLHDMRVAVRRARALLRAGAPLDRDRHADAVARAAMARLGARRRSRSRRPPRATARRSGGARPRRSRGCRTAAARTRAPADARAPHLAEGARRSAVRRAGRPFRRDAHDARADREHGDAREPRAARAEAAAPRRARARRDPADDALARAPQARQADALRVRARRREGGREAREGSFRTCSASITTPSSPRSACARSRTTRPPTRRSQPAC